MKTKKDLLKFYNVELDKLYKIAPSKVLKKDASYFRIIERTENKKSSTNKKLVLQTMPWYPESSNDWNWSTEQNLSFLLEVDYKLAPIKTMSFEEKKYIYNIIAPFKHGIEYVSKKGKGDKEWIEIGTRPEKGYEKEVISLFKFKKGTEYKGLKKNKKYSLDELD